MDIRRLLGANVRHFRTLAGLSQEAVSVRMGVDRAYVSLIERGGQNATLLSIHELAQALGVKPAALLVDPPHGEEPHPAEPGGV
ncbi:MAG: helix-turn-helix transcriptional regulator [Sphingomonadales bacterium]|nr:helix-turn-helix transcriptional regulator [Sphingomonadales bacterium]